MKDVRFLVILSLLVTSSCVSTVCKNPPIVEQCMVEAFEISEDIYTGACVCINLNISPKEVIRPLSYCDGYFSTSANNYDVLETYFDGICRDLNQCD